MEFSILVGTICSFLLAVIIGPLYIKWLKGKQFGQYIREDGPQKHLQKQGTPTMGAVIFVLPILVCLLFLLDLSELNSWMYVAIVLLFSFIGGIDDYFKVMKKKNEGLTSKQKMILQILFSVLIYFLFIHGNVSTVIDIPFTQQQFDLKYVYPIFVIFLFVGASNATNLTDGLDGLLAGNAVVSFIAFAVIALIQGNNAVFAVSVVVVGGLLGFLKFNYNPAKVFMGDMGSLVLGALMVGVAITLKVEVFLIFIGFVYVMETLSVIIQVVSFKTIRKRVFKMSPIHHHFELSGMNEKGVFSLFTTIQMVMCFIAVCSMRLFI